MINLSDYQKQERTLRELRDSISADMARVDDDRFNRIPEDGGWSAAQTLSHVIGAERKSLAYLQKKIQKPEAIQEAGLIAAIKSGLLTLAMACPVKIKAPPGSPEIVQQASSAELDAEWTAVRDNWHQFLIAYPREYADKAIYRHPIMGRLTLDQMLTFLANHLRRHSGQIRRALE